jgi:hypothetical protein
LGFLLALAIAGGYLMTKNQGKPEEPETVGEAGKKPDEAGVDLLSEREKTYGAWMVDGRLLDVSGGKKIIPEG